MRMQPSQFNVFYKKQVLALQLLAVMHSKKKKIKQALKVNYTAQTIVSELDETAPRNLDYLVSVNSLTSYLLLLVKKPAEALEFLRISERIAMRLLDSQQLQKYAGVVPQSLNDKCGFDSTQNAESFFTAQPSQITGVLLSNYFLSINLMTTVALKFSNSHEFEA
jgi:hypothetical protein